MPAWLLLIFVVVGSAHAGEEPRTSSLSAHGPAECPDAERLQRAALDGTTDLAGTITVQTTAHNGGLSIVVLAKNAAGHAIERQLDVVSGDCSEAPALVVAVARRALLTLELVPPVTPTVSAARPIVEPAPPIVAAPKTERTPWRLRLLGGGAAGLPLGGDVRAMALVRPPLAAPWQFDVGVDARVGIPTPLGQGLTWSARSHALVRLAVSLVEADTWQLAPQVGLGLGVVGAGGLLNAEDRAGALPSGQLSAGVTWSMGAWVSELVLEAPFPSVRVALDDGSATALPRAQLAWMLGTSFDL